MRAGAATFAAILYGAVPAFAQTGGPGATSPDPTADPMLTPLPGETMTPVTDPVEGPPAESFSHRLQAGVRATVGSGIRNVYPYPRTPPRICGPRGETTVCVGRLPVYLDLDGGFGVSDGVELTALARLGLEADFNGATPLGFGFGVRVYPSAHARFKFFLTLRVLADVTAGLDPDVGGRFESGFQFEFVRWVGLFLQFGASFGMMRWFRYEIDGGLGVQVRFP